MARRAVKEFVESIEVSNLALDTVFSLITNQTLPEQLDVVADPIVARAHRIYRALADQGLVPVPEVTHEAVSKLMHEVTITSAAIARDDSNLR